MLTMIQPFLWMMEARRSHRLRCRAQGPSINGGKPDRQRLGSERKLYIIACGFHHPAISGPAYRDVQPAFSISYACILMGSAVQPPNCQFSDCIGIQSVFLSTIN